MGTHVARPRWTALTIFAVTLTAVMAVGVLAGIITAGATVLTTIVEAYAVLKDIISGGLS